MSPRISLIAFTSLTPVLGRPYLSQCCTNAVTKCSAQAGSPTAKKRTRRKHQAPPENVKLISDVAVGDEFLGRISEVGGASSSWIDIGVVTKNGRPVRGRLRFPQEKSGARRQGNKDAKGAVIPVYVHSVNYEGGRVELRKGFKPTSRDVVPQGITMLDTLLVGDKLQGTVLGLGPYGAVLDVSVYRPGKRGKIAPCHGLLQRKSFRNEWSSAADKVMRSDAEQRLSIGDFLDVWVRAAHVENAFLVLDGYEVRPEEVQEARQQHRSNMRRRHRRASPDSLKVGQVLDGTVVNIVRFGLFVDVGVKFNGLVHYTEIGEKHRRDWKETIEVNTEVSVEVLEVKENRISLRLVSVKEEKLREAIELATGATARKEDVEMASALQAATFRGDGKRPNSKQAGIGKEAQQMPGPKVPLLDSRTKSEQFLEEHDAGDDEKMKEDKFSDEYLEDKYGF